MNSRGALEGRCVLLTGVSGAIGRHIAQTLAESGARIAGTYRCRAAEAEQSLAHVPTDRRLIIQADLDSPTAARALWAKAEAWHSMDTLVVNAAAMTTTSLQGSDDVAWDNGWKLSLDVNILAAASLMREAAMSFADRGYGAIIAISSWAAEQGSRIADASSYAASKAALRNFSQTLARAYAQQGVRVYIIAPGVVGAGMGTSGQTPDEIQAVAEGLTMGQLVDPQEVADLTAFLASDRCPSLTGSTLDLNGASYIR